MINLIQSRAKTVQNQVSKNSNSNSQISLISRQHKNQNLSKITSLSSNSSNS